MSSPPTISAFEFAVHRRDSQDHHHAQPDPPPSISQVSEAMTQKEDERHKYDDYDDYVPVNVTDGDDLTWAFECK